MATEKNRAQDNRLRELKHSEEGVMKSANRCCKLVVSVGLLLASLTIHGFAQNPHCTAVGGAILTNLGGFGVIDGSPTTLGVATGDLKGALGVQIVSASPDFTSISVQHHWVTDDGDTLKLDQATLHGAYVSKTLLAVTEYKIHLSGGTGRFAKATGDLSSIGEVDFATGDTVLRYSGSVCYGGSN
jgi:hypothetical protein